MRTMTYKATFPVLAVALLTLAACSVETDGAQTSEEHVWKEQTGAIDKAREVESILERAKEQKTQ